LFESFFLYFFQNNNNSSNDCLASIISVKAYWKKLGQRQEWGREGQMRIDLIGICWEYAAGDWWHEFSLPPFA
jgi:hypothetical protein